jgi:hypothetical protein
MPKDWPQVVEATEIVNCVISLCMVDRLSMEKRHIKIIALPGWIFLRFLTAISIMLYSQTLFE